MMMITEALMHSRIKNIQAQDDQLKAIIDILEDKAITS